MPAESAPCKPASQTPAGQWAAEHSWEYGFIIRYPAGAQATTGYTYEPWHLRYVGRPIAEDMKSTGITTLEKYFGLEAAPDYLQ
jgi:D-alanyl-D-alanine carboxypeptidase